MPWHRPKRVRGLRPLSHGRWETRVCRSVVCAPLFWVLALRDTYWLPLMQESGLSWAAGFSVPVSLTSFSVFSRKPCRGEPAHRSPPRAGSQVPVPWLKPSLPLTPPGTQPAAASPGHLLVPSPHLIWVQGEPRHQAPLLSPLSFILLFILYVCICVEKVVCCFGFLKAFFFLITRSAHAFKGVYHQLFQEKQRE